jgi:hypothetical protein
MHCKKGSTSLKQTFIISVVYIAETKQIPVVHKIKLNNLNEKILRGFVTYIVSDEADFFVGEV